MSWQQLRLTCESEHADELAYLLQELGANSITFLDNQDVPQFEEQRGEIQLWPETQVVGLFELSADTDALLLALKPYKNLIKNSRYELLEDKDWQEAWKDYFKPMRFGDNLSITPSWCENPDPAAANLILDPGMAFGTGTHPTTQLMLQWLDRAEIAGKVIVDYGCGSGILAMAAAKLGAKQVIAIDNDPNAVQTTRANATANGIDSTQLQVYLNDDYPRFRCDVMLANILANPLKKLASELAALTKPQGLCVLSGLLQPQSTELQAAYQPWFRLQGSSQQGDWLRLVFCHRAEYDSSSSVRGGQ